MRTVLFNATELIQAFSCFDSLFAFLQGGTRDVIVEAVYSASYDVRIAKYREREGFVNPAAVKTQCQDYILKLFHEYFNNDDSRIDDYFTPRAFEIEQAVALIESEVYSLLVDYFRTDVFIIPLGNFRWINKTDFSTTVIFPKNTMG